MNSQLLAIHKHHMEYACEIAKRSCCTARKVGAVVAIGAEYIAEGYNYAAPGQYGECPISCPKTAQGNHCLFAIHAESMALFRAVQMRVDLSNVTLYNTLSPCLSCAKVIHGLGIQHVIYLDSYAAYKGLPYDEGVYFLEQVGCNIVSWKQLYVSDFDRLINASKVKTQNDAKE
jgi:dCMP deaminase